MKEVANRNRWGLARTGRRKTDLERDEQVPNSRGVRVALGAGSHRADRNRWAWRDGPRERSPTRPPSREGARRGASPGRTAACQSPRTRRRPACAPCTWAWARRRRACAPRCWAAARQGRRGRTKCPSRGPACSGSARAAARRGHGEICRGRFRFQTLDFNSVWDLINPVSTFALDFNKPFELTIKSIPALQPQRHRTVSDNTVI